MCSERLCVRFKGIPVTVMIDQFFGVHPHLFRSGLWPKMKPGEISLYLYVMHESERYRTRQLRRTDAQVREGTGVAARTLCDARKKLQEKGLLLCSKREGNKFIYTICDPTTRLPYPGDPKIPARYTKIAKPNQLPVPSAQPAQAPIDLDKEPEEYGVPLTF
jgi:hypothetical protein